MDDNPFNGRDSHGLLEGLQFSGGSLADSNGGLFHHQTVRIRTVYMYASVYVLYTDYNPSIVTYAHAKTWLPMIGYL